MAMKSAIRGRQSIWVASRCWPLSLEEGREKSSLETNIRVFFLLTQLYRRHLDKIGHALAKVRLTSRIQQWANVQICDKIIYI